VRLGVIVAVLGLTACIPALTPSDAGPDPSLTPLDASDPTAPVDVQALAREVAAIRRLRLKAPLRATALDDAAFAERLTQQRAGGYAAGGRAGFWDAFGFAPSRTSIRDQAQRVLQEQVAGFYNAREKTLYVRGRAVDADHIALRRGEDVYVLAHEIEHALQDQNYGLANPPDIDDDGALARRAMLEADAKLTENAFRAARLPNQEHWVSRLTELLRSKGTDELVRDGGLRTRELSEAAPLLRRRLMFPYVDGLTFGADLYRAGGLPLLDRALAAPPASTEQVLHPQKYVAGEGPIPVSVPAAPAGWKTVASGTMGELQAGVLLAQCVPSAQATRAAVGWGGDAYAVVQDGSGKTAVLWSTAWDDDAAAARFEDALRARSPSCRTSDAIAAPVMVLREGTHVAYVQGFAEPEAPPLARALLALPADRPPDIPPVGAVKIPPLIVPEEEFAHRGGYDGGVWRSRPLGITFPLPDEFEPAAEAGSFEVVMRHRPSDSIAAFTVLMQADDLGLEHLVVRDMLRSLRAGPGFKQETLEYKGDFALAVGAAAAHTYEWHPTYGGHVQVGFVRACGGHATVVLLLLWGRAQAGGAMNRWLDALPLPSSNSPACRYLSHALD